MSNVAESTLGITLTSLERIVAKQMAVPFPITDDDQAEVTDIIDSGYRQYNFPPALPDESEGYRWSFNQRLATGAAISSGSTTLALPDDFGGGLRELYITSHAYRPIIIVDETQFKRQKNSASPATATDGPTIGMIYRSAGAGASESDRYTLEVYPVPDDNLTLDYFYDSIPDALSDAAPYPNGAQLYGELLVASCLQVVEFRKNEGAKGEFYQEFMALLAASVAKDRAQRRERASNSIFSQDAAELSSLAVTYPLLLSETGQALGFGAEPNAYSNHEWMVTRRTMNRGMQMLYYPKVLQGERTPHRWNGLKQIGTVTTAADDSDYDLPTNLASIIGDLVFTTESWHHTVKIIPEAMMRMKLNANSTSSGMPQFAAVRNKVGGTTGTAEQTQELLLWPIPSGVWTLQYMYMIRPTGVDATNLYTLLGPEHGETILNACLAAAEADPNGPRHIDFMRSLESSVLRDRDNHHPDFFGYNGNGSDHYFPGNPVIKRNGVEV